MWIYEKKLQHPVTVNRTDLTMAKYLYAQYGGPDSELSAGLRYLSQRYTMPTDEAKATLTDIGTEELAHWEIIATLIYKLTEDVPAKVLKDAGLGAHYTEHGRALYPHDAAGVPWTAAFIQSFEDPVTSLHEDLAAEEKARATYENLIDLTNDPGVIDALSFLREREVVHFQRFGETLDIVQDYLEEE
ncbi:Mn-containing catalase [Halobacteroides halobius DSM 5150]|uniref:Mn-containing catalase n=1 Tax=Halobacteroides halobius (strain ATCC 35273 / DSM 5150 / MD-1) TaxID=748449 RepID=L0KBP2_HALHC|nr:manganese catalase family protein [Halobacteroides halobius]AGB42426.1 Mn-containing catalase [Halobacteroides halobius DSM 5150]